MGLKNGRVLKCVGGVLILQGTLHVYIFTTCTCSTVVHVITEGVVLDTATGTGTCILKKLLKYDMFANIYRNWHWWGRIMACQFFVQSYVFKVYLYTLVCTVRRTCTIVGFLVNCLIGIHGCYVFI